ncbi:MAG: sigma-70 family RNA polymerase sigma factor [Burkholderiales bacterium]|nr:sigma-70 family RNA polymerase sigma factor [Burkholderiales bacterium]
MEGEQAALVALIPRLRRYARALAGDRPRADDLVQDTLERAIAKWSLWRPGTDLRAWTFTIMHNIFVNQVRRSTRDAMATDPAALAELELDDGQVADTLVRINGIERALAQLPDEQREVLLLITLEGLSYDETAHTLGIPAGTVMSRLSRARARLDELLEGTRRGESSRPLKVIK